MRNQFPVVEEWHKGAKTAGVGNISGKFVFRSVTAEGDGHSSPLLSPCSEALAPVSNSELENCSWWPWWWGKNWSVKSIR